MGTFISDKKFINENIFLYEKRLESQYTIFFDNKTPTFVTYYHINNINSITDSGLMNVENIIGSNSPIRFQKITDFPIYGIEQIKLDLNEEEEGLNASFESDGVILPNTIKPLPNDLFTISYIGKTFIFMVTSVEYDTIKSNNFYKINYAIRHEDDINIIADQILESYTCVFDNIGTDDKCIIRNDEYESIQSLKKWYTDVSERYMNLFYNARYNSFLFDEGNFRIYDKYLTQFINENKLFIHKNDYSTVIMSNEDYSVRFITEYDSTFYKLLEEQNPKELQYIKALRFPIGYPDSIFRYYRDNSVRSILFSETGDVEYLDGNLIIQIKENITGSETGILEDMVIKHFNKAHSGVFNIKMDQLLNYKIKYTFHDFLLIPVAMYIVNKLIQNVLTSEGDESDAHKS